MRNKSARLKKLTAKAAAGVELPKSSASKRATSANTRSSRTSKASAKAAVKGARTIKQTEAKVATSIAKRKASASMRTSRADGSTPSSTSSSTSRGRSSATLVEPEVESPSSSRSLSASTSRASSARKAAPAKSPRAPKRKRAPSVDKEEELRALTQRLKELEKALREREREVKKRESAIVKKNSAMKRTEEGLSREHEAIQKRVQNLTAKRREVDAESKELASLRKRLTAEEKVLARRMQREATLSITGEMTEPVWALIQLEEHFTCSLCYEVMACPYTLTAGRCGHSFCAICILQWCFAAVHRGCGYWHDSLECPLCRAELPYTSDHVPRSPFSFPFTPNRLADGTIKALVALIRSANPEPASSSTESGACTHAGRVAATTSPCDNDKLLPWKGTGAAYVEWEERDRKGRTEMTLLVSQWTTLQADDFVAFKDRLGV